VGQLGRASWITCLWPGLPRLWYLGDLSSLAVAVAFAALLNLVLWASFVRYDTVSAAWRLSAWVSLIVFWVYGLWQGGRQTWAAAGDTDGQDDQDLFIRAQSQYLRGHWVEAQQLLEQLIRREPGDVEAQLLLASVYRRSHRIDLSRRQLRQVLDCPGAGKWRFEIGREIASLENSSASGA
jgi:tetratricopeptide (TPR) repeat protein